jgi:hypothetical protein
MAGSIAGCDAPALFLELELNDTLKIAYSMAGSIAGHDAPAFPYQWHGHLPRTARRETLGHLFGNPSSKQFLFYIQLSHTKYRRICSLFSSQTLITHGYLNSAFQLFQPSIYKQHTMDLTSLLHT